MTDRVNKLSLSPAGGAGARRYDIDRMNRKFVDAVHLLSLLIHTIPEAIASV